jgi:hypothetical protein
VSGSASIADHLLRRSAPLLSADIVAKLLPGAVIRAIASNSLAQELGSALLMVACRYQKAGFANIYGCGAAVIVEQCSRDRYGRTNSMTVTKVPLRRRATSSDSSKFLRKSVQPM